MTASVALPEVHLEVRQGAGRNARYTLDHVDFLIGAVPGCDLRVPGADLPPVLCLIARQPGGARLRKLAPTQVLLVNGKTAANVDLADGDRITLGALDIFVHIKAAAGSAAAPAAEQTASSAPAAEEPRTTKAKQDLQKQMQAFRAQVVGLQEERAAFTAERQRQQEELKQRQKQLDEQAAELDQRRAEIQKEAVAARESAGLPLPPTTPLESAAVQSKLAEIEQERQLLATQRQELAEIRKQLYDRYQERRDRLAGLQEAVDKAAKKVQDRKQQIDADAQKLAQRRSDHEERLAEAEERVTAAAAEAERLEQERRRFQQAQTESQSELAQKLADFQAREDKLAATQCEVDLKLRQYETDVLRVERRQGDLERREQEVQAKTADFDRQLQQLQQDSQELETEAVQLDELRAKLTEENDRLVQQKQEQDGAAAALSQRAALLEGQQATLAALRTRLERVREDVRRQEQQLDEERARQEKVEAEVEQQSQALLRLKTELDNEERGREHERRQFAERSATLDAAVEQLKQAQQKAADEEERLRQRSVQLDERQAALADQEGVFEGRMRQLADVQQRLDAERQALRERTLAQTQAETAREALQEQLRRRGEELTVRQRLLNEHIEDYQRKAASFDDQREELDRAHQAALAEVEVKRQELEQWAEALADRQTELQAAEGQHQAQERQLQDMGRGLAEQRQALDQQQEDNQRAWQKKEEDAALARAEFDGLRQEAKRLVQLLPDAELRSGAALERVTHAREQLRDHVGEIHKYVRQCQEELDELRDKLQADVRALAEQEQTLRRGHDEHRVALVAFRQQLIDWQAQIVDLKRQLARGSNKLERRQAEMDQQVKDIDAAAKRLAQQSESLGQQQQAVAREREELDEHLVEMRQWYRHKLRQLAGIPGAAGDGAAGDSAAGDAEADTAASDDSAADAIVPNKRDILSITEPLDAGDLKLGRTLRELQLIDDETLTALLMESRRQRRSLRKVLLASGVVTLYQLALIEAGNVAGLMLGPVRAIDRLRATAQENVYRVFDPRRGREAVMRHLTAEALHDAGHAEEFRAGFTKAIMNDPHVAGSDAVLEVAGRPAVLQDWLTGLPASDWPPLAAAPGVCYRLLTQAALGLGTAHQAGLVHGRFDDAALLLTGEGIVKICGLGEPAWLAGRTQEAPATAADDLKALGRIAASWCMPDGVRKGAKTKPLPDALQALIQKLTAGEYTAASKLLADLDRAGSDVPPNAEAWDRLLKYVREHETPEALVRLSA
jgi:peptidoglycan hydrolase CwlO-like protein